MYKGKEGVCVEPCMAEHTDNTVEVGWLGLRLGNGCSGDFGWGSAIAPSYRFPHEGLPYHLCPERSPFFSHPRDTRLPLSLSFSTHPSLPSPPPLPPSIPSFHIHPALRRATFNRGGGGGGFKDSLSKKHTHKYTHRNSLSAHVCVCACVRSICQNSFSSVIGLGVPVSMR